MIITSLRLDNWKNFRRVIVDLRPRVFIVGPNASGKSNMLDAFRFLRDIAEPEGGFQRAVKSRGGVSQIRCLHARKNPNVAVEVRMLARRDAWEYRLEFSQDKKRRPVVESEIVRRNGHIVLSRPLPEDEEDPSRLTQTHLEQVGANKEFREIVHSLGGIQYLHIVPQLIRDSDRAISRKHDPFGSDFLEQIASTPQSVLRSRLRRINKALQIAVPQLKELKVDRDQRGVPHLRGLYKHWRPKAGWQSEEHFSDGTLRLLGLLWALLDGTEPLLLEEPELSLHVAVVRQIPAMMAGVQQARLRQIIVSTHSFDLLRDEGIAPEEVLLLEPSNEGTSVTVAAKDRQIRALLQGGLLMSDAVLPRTAPSLASQLTLFES